MFTDIDYVELIEQKITAIKKQYAGWVYDIKNIACISNADISFRIKDHIFLNTNYGHKRENSIIYNIEKQTIKGKGKGKGSNSAQLRIYFKRNKNIS